MRTNALSSLGRMGYGVHLAFYPGAFFLAYFVAMPWYNASNEQAKKDEYDAMVKANAVDPDLFNPFTPVPYHNNPSLKYVYSHINMRNYVNENHINVQDYIWKNYHNSFDHNNQKTYLFNVNLNH
uniref:Uncharacterized protein n=1 Tax=Strombidinopsis acuminata TaxID=141414 RepID=A0A7S3SZF4_9SPIT|mmetsp:Transcript_47951/g.65000  ORF Transcript_47951/g.65000 Transcript_47951/m.65000 type:complete len:125 (+) Transcript_47951:1-375(+)